MVSTAFPEIDPEFVEKRTSTTGHVERLVSFAGRGVQIPLRHQWSASQHASPTPLIRTFSLGACVTSTVW